jgi:hypothetical protein
LFRIFDFLVCRAKNLEKSQTLAKNGHFLDEKPKNEKFGTVRPSGFLRDYLGQKIGRKYQFLKVKKMR